MPGSTAGAPSELAPGRTELVRALAEVERVIALGPLTERTLAGEDVKAPPADRAILARALRERRRYERAAAIWAAAFEDDPAPAKISGPAVTGEASCSSSGRSSGRR